MMRQRKALLLSLLLVFIPLAAMGEGQGQEPEWVYPITADILENRSGF